MNRVLVTGGAGFIGSALVRRILARTADRVVNVDKLTYAGNLDSLGDAAHDERHSFERIDICDAEALRRVFERHQPTAVIHLAAESHVDRSIDAPADFISTNVVGTFNLLQHALLHWSRLPPAAAGRFRFIHMSTDEVFGSLGAEGRFTEDSPYAPSSPYSASKAASDHLVRAWNRTYGLPAIVVNCSNNYGPFQLPEKLIPLTIHRALAGEPLPVYGTGENVRDWIYVDDTAHALLAVLRDGEPGETYNVGAGSERRNIDVVRRICELLDETCPREDGMPRTELITWVTDRPGHDLRYAVDAAKIRRELGWQPRETFESGLRKTIEWYMSNRVWTRGVLDRANNTERLGLGKLGAG